MNDETLSLIMRARDEMSGVVNRAAGNIDKLGKSGSTANSILSGIGAGVGIAGVLGVANAVSTLTNVMDDAVRGAMEDERSQVALGVALRDNIPTWDGNTDAIERAIAARGRLGFADDQLRPSLATLVGVTHDENEALRLQVLAMNIARARGIDLATATDAVAKASVGNMRALQSVIPATRGAASASDALTIALKATGGQANAFADTKLGKIEAASIRVDESLERLGARALPLVADGADLAAGLVDLLTTVVDGATIPLRAYTDAAEADAQALEHATDAGYQALAMNDALLAGAKNAAATLTDFAVAEKYAAINAAAGVGPADAYQGALGRIWDTADGAWLALRRLHVQMGAGAVPVQVAANGMTLYGKTAADVTQANSDAILSQRAWIESMKETPRAAQISTAAYDRIIARLEALDAAQQTVFERLISNLTRVIDAQLSALDAAAAQREADRQAIQDKRDLAEAIRGLSEAQAAAAAAPGDAGAQQALLAAQQRLADVRSRISESALQAQEAKLRTALEATKTYIEQVDKLVSDATNRKALATTLAAREKSLMASRAKAEAAGDTEGVAQIDLKLQAIRAAEERNAQAMRIAGATAAVQVYTTVHTNIQVDGKTLSEIVDKYLGKKYRAAAA